MPGSESEKHYSVKLSAPTPILKRLMLENSLLNLSHQRSVKTYGTFLQHGDGNYYGRKDSETIALPPPDAAFSCCNAGEGWVHVAGEDEPAGRY